MTTRKIKPYKQTGNVAVDMVSACINHCERHYRTADTITLSPKYYDKFVEGVKRINEAYVIPADGVIDFDDVKVRRGSRLQFKPLIYTVHSALVKNINPN